MAHHASDDLAPLLRELLGSVLRDARLEQGLRLVDVAERAGISPQYLSEVERGLKDASSEMLAAIAEALGLDLRGLLTRAGGDAEPLDAVSVTPIPVVAAVPEGWRHVGSTGPAATSFALAA